MILAALVCYQRLLSYTSNDTTQLVKDNYLIDLNFLLNGQDLSNTRMIFEKMGFSYLRILNTFEDMYKDIVQLLAVSVHKEAFLLEQLDGLSNQYWAKRATDRLDYRTAYDEEGGFTLIEKLLASDIDSCEE